MNQQQVLPYYPKWQGMKAKKQRDAVIKSHIKQTEAALKK